MKTNIFIGRQMTVLAFATFIFLLGSIVLPNVASARIIFQDDDFHEIVSEGIIINSDDGGDEDVTLQFGNDASDATITFDDGTGNVTFATPGGDFDFSDDNITTSGTITADGALDANGAVTLGDGGDDIAIDSDDWDISSAGVVSGLTGITSTGTANFSGTSAFRIREDSDPATNAACAAVGELVLDTTDNEIQICTATGGAGSATWLSVSADDANTLDGLDSTQFLRSDTSDNYTSGTLTFDSGTTLTVNGVANIGDGGDDVAIDSDDWDISSTGAASGFTTFDASGNITTSAGDFIIGTTGLSETNGAGDNGATLVGVDQTEFTNSTSTNVQDVLDDLDALLGPNAGNVDEMTFEPEYPNAVVYQDGSSNRGKMEALYDDTNREHFYRWTTNRAADQDVDLRFRYELPSDFVDAGDLTMKLRTNSTSTVVNSAQVVIRNDTDDTTCHSDTAVASAAADTWEVVTVTAAEIDTGCAAGAALAAGDIVEVQIKLLADNGSSGADVGTIEFAYTN